MIPMHDLSCVVFDCAIKIQIERATATGFVAGRKVSPATETFEILATVVPGSGDSKSETGDGQFGSDSITIYSVHKILSISASKVGVADRVLFDGDWYCVDLVKNWFHLGGFYEVIATRESR
jgi:hypothetical protein